MNYSAAEVRTGLIAALGAVLVWGSQLPVAKSAYVVLDGYSLTALRYLPSAILLSLWLVWREGRASLSFSPAPFKLSMAGLVGMTGSPLLVFIGVYYTLPEHAVIILALQPSMTALAQWVLRGKRPPGYTLIAIGVAFIGVVLVVSAHDNRAGEHKLVGDLLVLAGAVCWVSYSMMLERMPRMSALRFTTLSCIAGTLGILLVCAVAGLLGAARMPQSADVVGVLPQLVFLSLFGVMLSMLAWNFGNARIGALNAVLLLNLMPVITYLIRTAQGAQFSVFEWVGAAMVVGALVANNLMQRRATMRAP